VANKSLTEIIKEMVDGDRVRLPIHPEIAKRVLACLAGDEAERENVWGLVNRDPGLLCTLFRSANSSFYAGLEKTLSVEEAVTRLGQEKAAQVIERSCREGAGCPGGELLPHYMPALWVHSRGCAVGAHWLATRCGYLGVADQAYLGGMFHDIGKLFLISVLEEVTTCGESGLTLSAQLIQEVVSTMHIEQGLRLFDEWNLPDLYREIVEDHHAEELNTQNIILALVKLANKGCRKVGLGLERSEDLVLPTTREAQFLGVSEITLAELEIMLEDNFLEGASSVS